MKLDARSAILGALLALVAMIPIMCSHDHAQDAKITALTDSVKVAKVARAAAIETVTVHTREVVQAKAESDRLGALVQLVGPTTLMVRATPASAPELVTVPATVIAKMRADSTTIALQTAQLGRLTVALGADSTVIRRQDALIVELERRRRCGPKCGAAILLVSEVGAGVVAKNIGAITRAVTALLRH